MLSINSRKIAPPKRLMRATSRLLIAIAFTLSSAINSWAIDLNVQQLITYETKANAAASRSDQMVQIEHYEIPLNVIESNVAQRLEQNIRDALIFEKNGQEYIRWLINPEDTKWHLEVEKFLRSKGLSTERHTHFHAYMTASRSYIIEDPITGAQFSAKVSTDKTGGNWRDKKQEIKDAEEIRMATDYVFEEIQRKNFKHVVAMDEPAIFGLRAVDQAMVIRLLAQLPGSNNIYLPGFSAVHEDVGAEIARRNGSDRPDIFWNEHYNQPLARALAEFAARTGLTYDSPHSQNFLIELDAQYKPTGRIVLRDFGDAYLLAEIPLAKGRKNIVEGWLPDNLHRGHLQASVGILHGNTAPSWLPDATYNKWAKDFYREFTKELSAQTGIPVEHLNRPHTRSGLYFNATFDATSAQWKEYFQKLSKERLMIAPNVNSNVRLNSISGRNCAMIFGT
jgi:hypothetical protein